MNINKDVGKKSCRCFTIKQGGRMSFRFHSVFMVCLCALCLSVTSSLLPPFWH